MAFSVLKVVAKNGPPNPFKPTNPILPDALNKWPNDICTKGAGAKGAGAKVAHNLRCPRLAGVKGTHAKRGLLLPEVDFREDQQCPERKVIAETWTFINNEFSNDKSFQ